MPLSSRLRSFSLRTLMVLVGVAAVLAWGWLLYRDRQCVRVAIALSAIARENPGARIRYVRDRDELLVYATGVGRLSPGTARLICRAESIRMIQLSARDDDGLISGIPSFGHGGVLNLLAGAFTVQHGLGGSIACGLG